MEPTMSRKSKSTSSQKKFTTVPPALKPATAKPVVAEVTSPVLGTTQAITLSTEATLATLEAPATEISQAAAQLLYALRDLDADVACDAATALGALGDASAVMPLIDVLKNSEFYFHSVVRSAAAVSLGSLKDRRAVEALLDAVNDPITDPSTEAIRALVALADPRAIDALVGVVRNSNGFFAGSVRRAAVLGLQTLGGDVASEELRRVAADQSEDSVIRQEAASSIAAA